MKQIGLSFLFIFALSFTQAQYSRVKLYADQDKIQELQLLGVALDHGEYKKGVFIIAELSVAEIELVESAGIEYDILIEDLENYYASDRSYQKDLSEYPCDAGSGFFPEDPENFDLGSMGGYFTYQEYLDNLDSMATLYPDLISVKLPIDTFHTHEGRDIYWVRISDNPELDEDEPEVLYTSLHHAREPASLSQNIYYMWYLLENYSTDNSIQGLVDNMELYFVPMINPDGYIQNENDFPNGGGMWRKNKRDNDGSLANAGVDLNRNYSYEWGGLGTSDQYNSTVYRGPSAFSEPETQAIKWLTQQHEFKFTLNYHTHGNWLLYPFGFDYDEYTEDHDLFGVLTDEMTLYNNYNNVISSGLYPAAGDSDDWMYAGDLDTKPKIMAMTPEVGDEFWPPSDEITGLCQENVYQNLMMARYAGVYAKVTYNGADGINGSSIVLPFTALRMGLKDGSITISFESLSSGMEVNGSSSFLFENPEMLATFDIDLAVTLDEGVLNNGEILELNVLIDNGSYVEERVYPFIYGDFQSISSEDCESLDGFIINGWGLTDEDAYTPLQSITDSPFSDYDDNVSSWIQLADPVDLSGDVIQANMTFWAKWEIEAGWDYAQVIASDNNGASWTPLCGNYTHAGSSNQDFDQPLYDGFQSTWVMETVDLTDFVGEEILIAFSFESDSYVTEDGFYFDDISINVLGGDPLSIGEEDLIQWKVYPVPATDQLYISKSDDKIYAYELIDSSGRLVKKGTINSTNSTVDVSDLEDGIYILLLNDNRVLVGQHKVQIIH